MSKSMDLRPNSVPIRPGTGEIRSFSSRFRPFLAVLAHFFKVRDCPITTCHLANYLTQFVVLPHFPWCGLGSCGQDALAQEIKVGSTVHLALEELKPVDLAFRLTATPVSY
jgi:hypothetical protein